MMQGKAGVSIERIEQVILLIRGQKVMLDRDLATLYGVPTKQFNRAIKRNLDRFPGDFMFQLTAEESTSLRCQFGTLKRGQHRKYLPYAFTEHGAIMAATVLNSPRAVQMSVFVVRAFVKMRAVLSGNRALARQLAALEQELRRRQDVQESSIVDILRRLMDVIDPRFPAPPKPPIGFHVKERGAAYGMPRAAARA